MNLSDKIRLIQITITEDERLNPIETRTIVNLGKCAIIQNSSAAKVKSNDGKDYIYSYVVYLRKPKRIDYIPKENDIIRITKKDGTIDKECRVVGFVTLKNWLKIWV